MVAESECDTSTNTFNQDTSVPADIGICGTCVKKEVKTCEQIGKENSKNYIDNSGSCAMGTKTAVDGVKDTSNNQCYYCNYSCYDYNDSGLTTEKYIYENEKCTDIQREKDKAEGKYDSEGNQCYVCKPELTPFPTTDPVTITITYYEHNRYRVPEGLASEPEGDSDLYRVRFTVKSSDGKNYNVQFKFDNFCYKCPEDQFTYPLTVSERDDSAYTTYAHICGTDVLNSIKLDCDRGKVNHAETLTVLVNGEEFLKQDQGNNIKIDNHISLLDDIQKTKTIGNITVKLVKGSSSNSTTNKCTYSTQSEAMQNCSCPYPRPVKISEGCYGCAEPAANTFNPCASTMGEIGSGTGIGSGIGSGSGSGGSMFIQ